MEKPLKIYLADLTYDTLQTAVFPLNVGLIASYCKKQFGSKVDITLFKYIDELDHAINESPPDILGLSNYVWNHHMLVWRCFTSYHKKILMQLRFGEVPTFQWIQYHKKNF